MTSVDYDALNKSLSDPVLFINDICGITLRDYQEQYINYIHNKQLTLSIKARQLGFSEITAYYLLWEALNSDNQSIGIMSSNIASSESIFDVIRSIMRRTDILCDLIVLNNKHHIQLHNGSCIMVLSATSNSLRGRTLDVLYIDEFAHVNDVLQRDIISGFMPIVMTCQTKVIIATSAGYKSTWVYDCWHNDKSQFCKLLFDYKCHSYDTNWAKHIRTQLDDRSFRSEYLCEFIERM